MATVAMTNPKGISQAKGIEKNNHSGYANERGGISYKDMLSSFMNEEKNSNIFKQDGQNESNAQSKTVSTYDNTNSNNADMLSLANLGLGRGLANFSRVKLMSSEQIQKESVSTATELPQTITAKSTSMVTYKNNLNATAPTVVSISKNEMVTTTRSHLLGDVNGDGKISLVDVSRMDIHLKGYRNLTDEEMIRADVNQDGIIDDKDNQILTMKLIGLEEPSSRIGEKVKVTNTTTKSRIVNEATANPNNPLTLSLSDGSVMTVTEGSYKQGNSLPITTKISYYDSLGNARSAVLYFTKSNINEWTVSLNPDMKQNMVTVIETDGTTTSITMEPHKIYFGNDGGYNQLGENVASHLVISNPSIGVQSVALDYSGLTQFAGENSINSVSDGMTAGNLKETYVNEEGEMVGVYTNGLTVLANRTDTNSDVNNVTTEFIDQGGLIVDKLPEVYFYHQNWQYHSAKENTIIHLTNGRIVQVGTGDFIEENMLIHKGIGPSWADTAVPGYTSYVDQWKPSEVSFVRKLISNNAYNLHTETRIILPKDTSNYHAYKNEQGKTIIEDKYDANWRIEIDDDYYFVKIDGYDLSKFVNQYKREQVIVPTPIVNNEVKIEKKDIKVENVDEKVEVEKVNKTNNENSKSKKLSEIDKLNYDLDTSYREQKENVISKIATILSQDTGKDIQKYNKYVVANNKAIKEIEDSIQYLNEYHDKIPNEITESIATSILNEIKEMELTKDDFTKYGGAGLINKIDSYARNLKVDNFDTGLFDGLQYSVKRTQGSTFIGATIGFYEVTWKEKEKTTNGKIKIVEKNEKIYIDTIGGKNSIKELKNLANIAYEIHKESWRDVLSEYVDIGLSEYIDASNKITKQLTNGSTKFLITHSSKEYADKIANAVINIIDAAMDDDTAKKLVNNMKDIVFEQFGEDLYKKFVNINEGSELIEFFKKHLPEKQGDKLAKHIKTIQKLNETYTEIKSDLKEANESDLSRITNKIYGFYRFTTK